MDEIKKGQQPFEYFTQYSEASTKAVGGDLGWVQTDTLPAPLAEAAQQMEVGQVAGPIQIPGGFSILYLVDERKVLTADPRDRSEEHTSELQSLMRISYAVFCLKKKTSTFITKQNNNDKTEEIN